jgi:hypothetical protein
MKAGMLPRNNHGQGFVGRAARYMVEAAPVLGAVVRASHSSQLLCTCSDSSDLV